MDSLTGIFYGTFLILEMSIVHHLHKEILCFSRGFYHGQAEGAGRMAKYTHAGFYGRRTGRAKQSFHNGKVLKMEGACLLHVASLIRPYHGLQLRAYEMRGYADHTTAANG